MNPDQLESLLLDRELGELSPAVAALLDAHLAQDPVAARRAADLKSTLQLARRAGAAPLVPPQRALDLERLRRAHRAVQTAMWRTEFYRLAACLALGLGLGWLARPFAPPAESGAAATPPIGFAAASFAEPRSTFWSAARLTANQFPPSAMGAISRRPLP